MLKVSRRTGSVTGLVGETVVDAEYTVGVCPARVEAVEDMMLAFDDGCNKG